METIILASNSPRRKSLLEQAGIRFRTIPADLDETRISETDPRRRVKLLSYHKALTVSKQFPDAWIIGADTVVAAGDLILEKPVSKEDAYRMLKTLSNTRHTVFTGFTLCCEKKNRYRTSCVKTDVYFKNLSKEEIEWYIDTQEPYDKAGGYAIQGQGAFIVKRISGSYTNVVGLPLCELIEMLVTDKIIAFRDRKSE